MSSTLLPTTFALLHQLDATLELVVTLSPSLTINELRDIRQGLVNTYTSVKVLLSERALRAQRATACKFHANFVDPYSLPFNEDDNGNNDVQPQTRGLFTT